MYRPHASWPVGGAAAAASAALHTADTAGAAAVEGGGGCASGNSSSTRCISHGMAAFRHCANSAACQCEGVRSWPVHLAGGRGHGRWSCEAACVGGSMCSTMRSVAAHARNAAWLSAAASAPSSPISRGSRPGRRRATASGVSAACASVGAAVAASAGGRSEKTMKAW